MSGMSMRERLKARREKLKEATSNSDAEPSPRKNITDESEIQEEDGGTKETESLISDIKKRRSQAQKELNETKKEQAADDSAAQKREKARRRLRERIQNKSASEADNTVSALSQTELSEDGAPSTLTKSLGGTLAESIASRKLRASSTKTSDLRASVRERIKAATAKGKDEAYDEARTTNRKLRGARSVTRKTRFDDPSLMKKEDFEIEQQLEKSIAARSKWKQAVEKKSSLLPSQQEAYDFFTMVWEPEPEDAPPAKKAEPEKKEETPKESDEGKGEETKSEEQPGTSKDAEETEGKDETEDKKKKKKKDDQAEDEEPLLEDLEREEPGSWEYYQIGRAQYEPFHDRIQKEDKIYFAPSMRAAPTQDKVFDLPEPRFLEEEGFYVGEKPIVSSRNINRMENRLLRQKDVNAGWFGEDGRLIVLPDPLKEVPSRPPIPEEADPLLEVEFKKAEMTDFDTRLIDGSLEGSGRYQLDVDINTLVFSHHHLFSLEHVLASRITGLYNQYIQRNKIKRVIFLTDKLKALRNAALHVHDNINLMKEDNRSSGKALHDQENRLREYKDEIKLTRSEREQEMRADRMLLKNIIDTWREIKKVRQVQGFNNTSVKLKIQKEAVDKTADQNEWAEDIEDEVREVQEEAESGYVQRLDAYKSDLEAYKKQKQLKKEAKKRQGKRERRQQQEGVESVDGSEDGLLEEDNDNKILAEEDLDKPEKPTLLDVEGERAKIRARYMDIRRQPGEPKLHPELSSGATITATNLCPRGEQQRRNDVNRHRVFIKVLFNNKEVSRTPAKPLGQDFTIRFAQIFNVQIVQWPEGIKIQVFEAATLSSDLLAEVFAVIPDVNVTSETVQLDDMEFSSAQRVSHSHNAVGSGVNINMDEGNTNVVCLNTTGALTMGVAWAINDDGMVLVPPTNSNQNARSAMKALDAVAALGAAGLSDINQLNKWIAQSRLDPNDPSNADLMHMVRPGAGGDLEVQGHFRLEHLQEEFNFVDDESLEKNRRFKALRYRSDDIPQFKGVNIPALEREITDTMFDEYEKKREEEEKIRLQDITSHRVAVTKFMQHVREQVMNRFRRLQSEKTLSDMVYEDAVPNIGTIIPNLLKMTEPRRPLKPVRKERKKMTAQNLKQEDVRLLINIVRAFDIPVRSDALQGKNKSMSETAGTATLGGDTFGRNTSQRRSIKNIAGEVLVRPFIEVMFQRNTQSTSVAEGPNPSWNEELQIPFRPPNDDFSTSSLQTIKDSLFINLFDENVVDVLQDDRERGTSIHRRIERRWLGSLKIPFSTIYFNSRIDGTFRINKPPVLLGYQHDPHNRNMDVGAETDRPSGQASTDHTYVTMFITVEPQLTPADSVKEKFETNEDDKLITEGDKWLGDLEKRFPKRDYKTTVVDINGKSVFICRYFKELAPPEALLAAENPRETAEKVARFVALIPFVSDSVVFPGTCDIWSTCDQFVQMLQGDEEEHAVLLTCYFLNMKKDAYLLLGSAIPEGPTAYVLTKEERDYWIWNAATGEHFSYRDNYCPVTSVGCLVNADNIWANIQPHGQPSRLHFDVKNATNWKPFFHKNFRHPGLSSVQPERLIYVDTPEEYVLDIQDKIERTLREKIMEWRPRHITRWNRYCIQTFKQILPRLELNRGRESNEHMEQLQQLQNSYKLSGFPINMPYTEVEPLIEAVYATGVHNNDTNEVEYALAVYIHPYPCSVLSVWVYVASLSRKR